MENEPDLKFRTTLKNIRLHFDFLFKRGFRIAAVMFVDQNNENWQITLMADDCLIEIYSAHGEINLAMGSLQLHDEINLFDLEDLAHFVNRGKEFFYRPEDLQMNEAQQFRKIARFLEKNMDTILAAVEKKKLTILNRPLYNSITQQNRRIV